MATTHNLLLDLPLDIQRQIFGYLLVPGCIEIGGKGQKCYAVLTYPILVNRDERPER